ncbi:FtsK/SpoIIIE domain-containing protein [Bacillus sp. T33-2]|uniref:FtsK/SpoIIIE domain-containing protein n=1 Tax=Bacillus sp. T33-2 TaxID=2054168 RepID=UPI000C769F09|nr:FtsK/SpoIIIE domain-containing protein [Bacillus sp. T33-2]PLR99623.1 hypothetical protein CVD19_00750 [Bacillus sp. T33-2]
MSLTRIINKTPLANDKESVYEIEEINDGLIGKILGSRFIPEGVYCIEQLSMQDYKEQYLITPSFDKFEAVRTGKDWNFKDDIKHSACFELILDKPMFQPLDTKQFIDLFNEIANIADATVFAQVLLCKRQDNWRELAINQYEGYLSGNDSPFDNQLANKVQDKFLKVLTKISNYAVTRDPVEEMERKILQNNYRFEGRFVVFDEKEADIFCEKMQKMLNKLQLFNDLILKKVTNKKSFIRQVEERSFQSELVNQLLSEEEVHSLLCKERTKVVVAAAEKTSSEIKPIKHQSITKNLEDSIFLQRAIQLMPFKQKQSREIDQSKAEQINNALKRVGIVKKSLKVTEMYQGASLLKVQLSIPPEITYTSISKKLVDIQASMGNEGVTIEIGDKPDTINVFIPMEERDVVYFRNILESEEFADFKQKNLLPFIIGESANGGYIFGCLSKLRHILVAGTTGSGKSVFVNLIIISLLLCVPPEQLALYLVDPKVVEFSQFNGFPQVKEIITDMRKADKLLASLCTEMDNRYEIFANAGCRDIIGYNELNAAKMPFIICVIDELADLMMVNKAVEDHIVRLGQKARGAGIHLVIATQRPSVDVVTGLIKANLPNRFAFSVTSQIDSRTILDKGGAEKLLGQGDGLAKVEGGKKEFERFQSPILTLDVKQEQTIYEWLKEQFEDAVVRESVLPEIKVEEPIDKLKRIIAETNETRISELQKLMGIRINIVSDLVKELVSEGWLEKQGKGYVVIVDDEELSKWRTEVQ